MELLSRCIWNKSAGSLAVFEEKRINVSEAEVALPLETLVIKARCKELAKSKRGAVVHEFREIKTL